MRKFVKSGALVALCMAVTTACGSSGGSSNNESNTSAASGSSGGESSSNSSSSKDTSPIKVGLVVPLSGAAAIPRIYVSPAEMAIDDINKAGGVNGRKLELDKVDSGFTPQSAITAVNKAVGDHVSVIIGLPISSQNLAIRSIVDQAKIPVLQLSVGDESAYNPQNPTSGASKYSFRIGNANSTQVRAASTFAVDGLKAKNVGLLADTDSAKSVQSNFEKAVAAAGGSVGPVRTYPISATDLTTEALAMKGNDAVVDWSYPTTMALGLKQMIQNGISIPMIGSQSAFNVITSNLLPNAMLKYLYGTGTCNPVDDSRANVKKWVADFTSRFKFDPESSSAETYDAINIFAMVFKQAGADSQAQLEALQKLDYSDGLCAAHYLADAEHNTAHSSVISSFENGKAKTVKSYDFSK